MNIHTPGPDELFQNLETSIQNFLKASKQCDPVRAGLTVVGAGRLPSAAALEVRQSVAEVPGAPTIRPWSPTRYVYEEQPRSDAAFYAGVGGIAFGSGIPTLLWMAAFAPAELKHMASLLLFIG